MFTISKMSVSKKRKVITKCNIEKTVWNSRDEAKDFFIEAMMLLENEERDRAECVYSRFYMNSAFVLMTN